MFNCLGLLVKLSLVFFATHNAFEKLNIKGNGERCAIRIAWFLDFCWLELFMVVAEK